MSNEIWIISSFDLPEYVSERQSNYKLIYFTSITNQVTHGIQLILVDVCVVYGVILGGGI